MRPRKTLQNPANCASPRLAERWLCSCVDPKLCPYSEDGRRRILEKLEAAGRLDENGNIIR